MEALGTRIKQLRLRAKLSKAALARRVGVSDVSVSYWESGAIKQIGHERLLALAEALNCSLEDLLDAPPPPPTSQPVLFIRVHQAAPWLRRAAPVTILGELPVPNLSGDCHLVTPALGEEFDFIEEGDLAAVKPTNSFMQDGLYILDRFGQLLVRYLSRTDNGEIDISDESQRLERAQLGDMPFKLLGQVRALWQLTEIDRNRFYDE
ncbi:Helix-turn-helix [Modicisalibacter ilicicola DSM 19980]|uniref:Helix-turn-helix n=1 Tax=Modicisalibacter ilicicola DSM 19980 TaxID=1121942 RepID=A0A1M4Y595_9GAMM|nr:helix-turn-helix transcriptional regulator [Halomonas ilicicola]SHF00878.1 Helix-turn-helix [Halomonas ilicicola DSM 19980]